MLKEFNLPTCCAKDYKNEFFVKVSSGKYLRLCAFGSAGLLTFPKVLSLTSNFLIEEAPYRPTLSKSGEEYSILV